MANRQIVIDVVGNTDSLSRATDKAVDKADGLNRSWKANAVTGAAVGIASAGVTAALDLAATAISGAIDAAREDTASQDQLALAYKNTGQAQQLSIQQIEAAISANQAKGVSDSEQRAGISAFLDLTKDATTAMQLNTAATDLAAAKDITYEQAQKMVLSAASGRAAALQKAGVQVEKGATATQIAAAVEDKYAGSLDKVATTQAGKGRIANEKLGEAMEKVGRIINDVATTVIPVLVDALVWVIDNVLPPLIAGFEAVIPVLRTVFTVAANIVRAWVTGVQTYFGIVATIVRTVFNGVIDIINGVIAGINAIQVHVHVGPVNLDWNGANLSYLPRLHSGGIVPGVPGSDVLTLLQAGERVIPAAGAGGGGNTYQLTVLAIDPQSAAVAVVDAIDAWERMRGPRYARA
jgi:uncharacterized membrane protein